MKNLLLKQWKNKVIMNKRYLVLGGNGFIGKNLVAFIHNSGCEVTSFDYAETDNKIPGVTYIKGDFFDDVFLNKLLDERYDVIYHAISTINPGNSNTRYIFGYGNDLLQTVKMCSLLKDKNVKLIFLSSGGTIYGNQKKQPICEDQTANPINHYGNIKLSIENALRVFKIQEGLDVHVARISNPYGPGQDYSKGVGFIDAALKKALSGDKLEIWGDGSIVRDYIYIDDVCRYLFLLSQYNGDEFVINISSNYGASLNEVIEIIKSLNINVQVDYKQKRSVDVPKIVLSNLKMKSLLGTDLISLKDGITKYKDYLESI